MVDQDIGLVEDDVELQGNVSLAFRIRMTCNAALSWTSTGHFFTTQCLVPFSSSLFIPNRIHLMASKKIMTYPTVLSDISILTEHLGQVGPGRADGKCRLGVEMLYSISLDAIPAHVLAFLLV